MFSIVSISMIDIWRNESSPPPPLLIGSIGIPLSLLQVELIELNAKYMCHSFREGYKRPTNRVAKTESLSSFTCSKIIRGRRELEDRSVAAISARYSCCVFVLSLRFLLWLRAGAPGLLLGSSKGGSTGVRPSGSVK